MLFPLVTYDSETFRLLLISPNWATPPVVTHRLDTIIGDGRTWDTVQFVAANSRDELNTLAAGVATQVASGDAYVIGICASLDAITHQ